MRRHDVVGELLLVGVLGLALVGCSEPKRNPPSSTALKKQPVAASPSQTQGSAAPKSARKAEPPGPGDRDPFNRPKDVKPPVAGIECQGKVVLRDHAISELQLTGVVGGGATQAAMLRVGSSGVSGVVHRGERLGKSCSRVKTIHRDRIVLELRRKVDDKSTSAEQVLKLTPKAG